MNASFALTPAASQDINDIVDFVYENSGLNQAHRVHRKLADGFRKIGEHPGIGHPRPELIDESVRVYTVYSFLVIYRSDTKPVEILRIIHGARDLNAAMEE